MVAMEMLQSLSKTIRERVPPALRKQRRRVRRTGQLTRVSHGCANVGRSTVIGNLSLPVVGKQIEASAHALVIDVHVAGLSHGCVGALCQPRARWRKNRPFPEDVELTQIDLYSMFLRQRQGWSSVLQARFLRQGRGVRQWPLVPRVPDKVPRGAGRRADGFC